MIEYLPLVLTGLGLIVSILYYAMVLRNQNKTRQAQLFMQLYQKYITKEWWADGWELFQMEWEDFDDFARKYDSIVNMDNFTKRYVSWYFFDGIGLLLKKNLVDKEMIYYLMGGYGAIWNWLKFEHIIVEGRKRLHNPDHLIWFEYLANEMLKIRESRGHKLTIPEGWGTLLEPNP
jgi:hypothetical protein